MSERARSRDRKATPEAEGLRAHTSLALTVGVLVGFLIFLACAGGGSRIEPERYHETAEVAGASAPLGADSCLVCHGHQPAPAHHLDCESCHGSGAIHVQNVEDPAGIRFPSNADCLDCHETGHRGLLAWEMSEHGRAGLLCADCHDPHNGEPLHVRTASELTRNILPNAGANTRLCAQCHREVVAQLNLPSHHPVREGMLDCTDCHGPHEAQDVRLGDATARCTECHQAQAGPWIYEHTPVSEDCAYCHAPHGAGADSLLVANQPGACAYCHSLPEMGATHDPEAYVTRCTDCHSAVHGSYADPHLRR